MQRLASEIIGAQLLTVHTGNKVGEVNTILIRKKDLKLELLTIKLFDNYKLLYLLSDDIRAFDKGKVIINSYDELSEAADLLRHKEVISENCKLFGTKVQTQSGKNLGRVKDYSVDMAHLFATKLHIRANWPQRLIHERLIIDRSEIVDITRNTIVVRDATAKAKSTAKVLPA